MSLIPFDAIELACNLCPEIADNLDLFEDFVALTGGELTTEYKNAFSQVSTWTFVNFLFCSVIKMIKYKISALNSFFRISFHVRSAVLPRLTQKKRLVDKPCRFLIDAVTF